MHPILEAADRADPELIEEMLLDDRLAINARDPHGRTLLHLVILSDRGRTLGVGGVNSGSIKKSLYGKAPRPTDTVKLLLEYRADMTVLDSEGWAPLHTAAIWQHQEIMEIMVANGCDIDIRGTCQEIPYEPQMTPLHIAARTETSRVSDYFPITKFLLSNGADANAKTASGRTPLHLIQHYEGKKKMELLLMHGADVNARDNQGRTPLQIAEGLKQHSLVTLLRQHGGQV